MKPLFNITSSVINVVAENVIVIYLFEGTVRTVIASKLNIVQYK